MWTAALVVARVLRCGKNDYNAGGGWGASPWKKEDDDVAGSGWTTETDDSAGGGSGWTKDVDSGAGGGWGPTLQNMKDYSAGGGWGASPWKKEDDTLVARAGRRGLTTALVVTRGLLAG